MLLSHARKLWLCPLGMGRGLYGGVGEGVGKEGWGVLVVGGGHAGTEAAAAAARTGAKTLLVTQRRQDIGHMACNPSWGGVGKGHLVAEVDALDGLCGRVCDRSGIHFRVLNRSKGPAVWGQRAQIDREMYRDHMQDEVRKVPGLWVLEAAVEDLVVEQTGDKQQVTGVVLGDGSVLQGRCVVLTTGTFLGGEVCVGLEVRSTRPQGTSVGLSLTLTRLGFRLGRLKTGTPPRISKRSVDFKSLQKQLPDSNPIPFSFMSPTVWIQPGDQLPCFLTRTGPEAEKIIRENLHLNRHVRETARGPRYCPSLEAKVLRFPGRCHQVWLEPEGLDSDVIYPQGLSVTLPVSLQQQLIRTIPGLYHAELIHPGYGVQYDHVDPRQLRPSLEARGVRALFFAGQINGTTGYEEAAAQGVIAGINAGLRVSGRSEFTVSRGQGYVGVMIDDLITMGVTEPYRMFSSRSELRISLRPENADQRLTLRGYVEGGCVSSERVEEARRVGERIEAGVRELEALRFSAQTWRRFIPDIPINNNNNKIISAFEMLQYPGVDMETLSVCDPHLRHYSSDPCLAHRLKVQAVYHPQERHQKRLAAELRRDENLKLPENLDYYNLRISLSTEAREALTATQPLTVGAASRIPGVTPAAVGNLLQYVKTRHRERHTKRHTERHTERHIECKKE